MGEFASVWFKGDCESLFCFVALWVILSAKLSRAREECLLLNDCGFDWRMLTFVMFVIFLDFVF